MDKDEDKETAEKMEKSPIHALPGCTVKQKDNCFLFPPVGTLREDVAVLKREIENLKETTSDIKRSLEEIKELLGIYRDLKGAVSITASIGKAIAWLAGLMTAIAGILAYLKHMGPPQ